MDWDREPKPWDYLLPKWYRNTPPNLRSLRVEQPYLPMWKEIDEQSMDHGNDTAVLEKQHDDSMEDAHSNESRNAAKGATPQEVARLRQGRQQGQRFPTDEPIASHRSNDYEFLEGKAGAEKWQRTKKL